MTKVKNVITLAGRFFQKLHKSDLGKPMSDLRRRRKMKDKSNLSETIFHSSLIKTQYAEDYALTLQEIYDYNFKQLELSIREMGYGDVAINKKMKNYLNIFHLILEQISNWENESDSSKSKILSNFLDNEKKTSKLIIYFDNYITNLSNNTLNFYIKGVVKDKF